MNDTPVPEMIFLIHQHQVTIFEQILYKKDMNIVLPVKYIFNSTQV